jgi:hypothetical protein
MVRSLLVSFSCRIINPNQKQLINLTNVVVTGVQSIHTKYTFIDDQTLMNRTIRDRIEFLKFTDSITITDYNKLDLNYLMDMHRHKAN